MFVNGVVLYIFYSGHIWLHVLGGSLVDWGLVIVALGILPTDRKPIYFLIPLPCIMYVIRCTSVLITNPRRSTVRQLREMECVCSHLRGSDQEACLRLYLTGCCLITVLAFAYAIWPVALLQGIRVLHPRVLLRRFWQTLFWVQVAAIAINLCMVVVPLVLMASDPRHFMWNQADNRWSAFQEGIVWLPNQVLVVLVLARPSCRHRLQAFLVSHCEGLRVASAIAALLGRRGVEESLRKGQQLFRCVRCDQLTPQMLATGQPDTSYAGLSEPAQFGEVDAFLSHSWHDSPPDKWEALQAWRAAFKAANAGREPTVWLDKLCLDQTNIDESLQSLPVFLSGCKELIVLAGETYLTRLWCIVELFVFLETGGKLPNLHMRLLGNSQEQCLTLCQSFRHFDAAQVTCTREDDKERLLAFVEAAFGDLDHFSAEVRKILAEACKRYTTSEA